MNLTKILIYSPRSLHILHEVTPKFYQWGNTKDKNVKSDSHESGFTNHSEDMRLGSRGPGRSRERFMTLLVFSYCIK